LGAPRAHLKGDINVTILSMHAIRRGTAVWLIRRLLPLGPLLLLIFSGSAFAHGGEDHGDAPAPAAALHAAPRVVAQTDQYELVGILKAERLVIYLDRFADNSPVTDAAMMVSINGTDTQAQRDPDGTYSVASTSFAGTGAVDLVFNVSAPSGDDLLIGSLKLPHAIEGAATSASATHPISMLRQFAGDRLSFSRSARCSLGFASACSRAAASCCPLQSRSAS
jgi:hypothetical protein